NQKNKVFEYDLLVISTGASPFVPRMDGIDLDGIQVLRTIDDAREIRDRVDQNAARQALVVGGGFIGLEVAENLVHRGIPTTLVEFQPQILPGYDPEMALIAENHLVEKGLSLIKNRKVVAFEGDPLGKVQRAKLDDSEVLPADLVVWATGVRPNVELARNCGIVIGPTGAIQVDERMETNIPGIYAVGDCAENHHLLLDRPVWFPMGSTANKAGRIVGINASGGSKKMPGLLGTNIVKLFDLNAARTGLSTKEALEAGFEIETVLVPANDKAHYYPGYRNVNTKLIADRKTHRVLGGQIIGEGVVDKPIDILVTAISFGATVEDLTTLDLAYAPPFSMAMSSLITAANVLENKLTGKVRGILPTELFERMERGEDFQIVDLRSEPEFIIGTIEGALHIPLTELSSRIEELDPARETVLLCKYGKRSYLGARELTHAGFEKVEILEGGLLLYPYEIV
ncbi:MAG TPA: FAD-dependent oxidoreductase, partial [Chroococcales cyanobacterium]